MKGEEMKNESMSRRGFVAGTAGLVAAGAAATLVEYKGQAKAADAIEWADEADVVIVGAGFAGLSAAMTAKVEFPELNVKIVDACPVVQEIGGNSRVCGQVFTTMDDVDAAVDYLNELNGGEGIVEPEYVRAWAERTVDIAGWVKDVLGADLGLLWMDIDPPFNGGIEFPEYKGSEHVTTYCYGGAIDESMTTDDGIVCGTLYGWALTRARELGVEVQINTRVVDFVLDGETREIRGVLTESGEGYKAKKGVILACGGFENDLETLRQYLPLPTQTVYPSGTPYNRGDGVRMTMALGAKMWHMNNFASFSWSCYTDADHTYWQSGSPVKTAKDFVFIGPRGKRFVYEERSNFLRHGKSDFVGGMYSLQPLYTPAWMVFGKDKFEADDPVCSPGRNYAEDTRYPLAGDGTNATALAQGIIVKGDTLEELAANMGLDERWIPNFVEEIETYNDTYVEENYDYDFKRGTYFFDDGCPMRKEIKEFELVALEPPYYAIPLCPRFLNTQGGPKRNDKCQVLDMYENVIPRLYTAGELGAIYASDYNGGGNVCEDWTTGREAMRQVATLDSWE